jgi:hypothetical protein
MKYCSHCGEELRPGAAFCPRCGQPASPSADAADAADVKAPEAANDAETFKTAAPAEKAGPMFERGPKASSQGDWGSDGWEEAPAPSRQPAGGGNGVPPRNLGSLNPYDHTAAYDPREISDNKVICMLIYLFPVAGLIIALLADRASDARTSYIGFHVRQEIKLDVFSILVSLVTLVVTWLITLISGVALSSASSYGSYGYYGASSGLLGGLGGMLAGLGLQLLILGIVALVLFIVRLICFVQVCKSRAVEAPIVRGIRFMR